MVLLDGEGCDKDKDKEIEESLSIIG